MLKGCDAVLSGVAKDLFVGNEMRSKFEEFSMEWLRSHLQQKLIRDSTRGDMLLARIFRQETYSSEDNSSELESGTTVCFCGGGFTLGTFSVQL